MQWAALLARAPIVAWSRSWPLEDDRAISAGEHGKQPGLGFHCPAAICNREASGRVPVGWPRCVPTLQGSIASFPTAPGPRGIPSPHTRSGQMASFCCKPVSGCQSRLCDGQEVGGTPVEIARIASDVPHRAEPIPRMDPGPWHQPCNPEPGSAKHPGSACLTARASTPSFCFDRIPTLQCNLRGSRDLDCAGNPGY